MKFIRLLLRVLVLATATAAVLVIIAFIPAVQTWVAQMELSSRPGVQGTIGSLSAGFGQVDVNDLHVVFGGGTLTVPSLQAKLPLSTALWRRRALVRSLTATGWRLDLSRSPGFPDAGSPAAATATPDGSTGLPAHADAIPALKAARIFSGILREWKLPFEVSLDGIELEGDVVVPSEDGKAPAMVHVIIKGGGMAEGREGSFDLDVASGASDSLQSVRSLLARGRLAVSMDSPRSVGRVALQADVAATLGSLREEMAVSAAVESRSTGEEAYAVDLSRGGRHVVAVRASLPVQGRRLAGTWKVDLRDSDLAPFVAGRPLPSISATGDGLFDADDAFARVHAAGRLNAVASHLEALGARLDRLGTVALDARFDLVHGGHSVRVDNLTVSLAGARPVAVAQSLQPFDVDERTGGLRVTDSSGDWMALTIRGLPMDWLCGGAGGTTVAGNDATGAFLVRASTGGFSLVPRTPLTASGVSVTNAGGMIGRGLDLSVLLVADTGPQRWQVQLAPFTVDCAGRRLLKIEGKASRVGGSGQPVTIGGAWSANLEALASTHAAPAAGWITGRSASGDFSATLGITSEIVAKAAALGRDPSHSISASVRATVDADGSMAFLAPVKVAFGPSVSELSAEGTWAGGGVAAGGVVNLTGGDVHLDHLCLLAAPLAAAGGAPFGPSAAGPASASGKRIPFWGDWVGRVSVVFDGLRTGDHDFSDVDGTFDIDHDSIRLEGGRGAVQHRYITKVEGAVEFDPSADLPYSLKATTAAVSDIDAALLFPAPQAGEEALVEGKFSLAGTITGSGGSLGSLVDRTQAQFRIKSSSGIVRLLQTSVAESIPEAPTPVSDVLDTVGSVVGPIFGRKGGMGDLGKNPVSANAEAVMSFTNEISEIGFDAITANATRASDGSIRITDLDMTAKDERLTGSGKITYVKGQPLFQQPLSLDLKLGARGKVADLLSKAGLLSSAKDDLGYIALIEPVHFGGTMQHIDESQWHDLLVKAATRKLEAKK